MRKLIHAVLISRRLMVAMHNLAHDVVSLSDDPDSASCEYWVRQARRYPSRNTVYWVLTSRQPGLRAWLGDSLR